MHFATRLFSIAGFSALPALALNISGTIVDKLQKPIAQASICLTTNLSSCVSSDAGGAFRISDGITGLARAAARGYALESRRGALSLTVPAAVAARVEWIDAQGRSLADAATRMLSAGANAVPLPAAPGREGIAYLRVSTRAFTATWKTVLQNGAAAEAQSPRGPAASARVLGKIAATSNLQISKSGYITKIFTVLVAVQDGVQIQLAAVGDTGWIFSGTYTEPIASINAATKQLILSVPLDSCNGSKRVSWSQPETLSYYIATGRMYLYTPGGCDGESYAGSASTPVGTWSDHFLRDSLPAAIIAKGCPTTPDFLLPSPYKKDVATLSANLWSSDLQNEACPGDNQLTDWSLVFTDSLMAYVKNTCRQVAIKNRNGDTATVTYTRHGDSTLASFDYKSFPCTLETDQNPGTGAPRTCPDPTADPQQAWYDCIQASGFAQEQPIDTAVYLAKVGAHARHAPKASGLKRRRP